MWDSVSPAALRRNRQYRRYLLAGGAVAVVGTLAYRAYQSDAYGRSKAYLLKLRTALQQYTDAAATGGEICATILRDLQTFLASDAAEVPPSLRQVSRLLQSREFTATATSTVEAIYRGVAGKEASLFAFTGIPAVPLPPDSPCNPFSPFSRSPCAFQ